MQVQGPGLGLLVSVLRLFENFFDLAHAIETERGFKAIVQLET